MERIINDVMVRIIIQKDVSLELIDASVDVRIQVITEM